MGGSKIWEGSTNRQNTGDLSTHSCKSLAMYLSLDLPSALHSHFLPLHHRRFPSITDVYLSPHHAAMTIPYWLAHCQRLSALAIMWENTSDSKVSKVPQRRAEKDAGWSLPPAASLSVPPTAKNVKRITTRGIFLLAVINGWIAWWMTPRRYWQLTCSPHSAGIRLHLKAQ